MPSDTLFPGDTTNDGEAFRCTPTVFTLRDTITIRMAHPHGEYLIVTQPNGTTFFLTYPNATEPQNYLLVPNGSFIDMPTIRFRANIKAHPQIFGRDTLETVFDRPGKYVVTVGHKMESEHASEVTKCTIRLR
jgi:hypothetical protein